MATLKVVITVLHLLIAFGLMVTVLFQSSKSQGLSGSIAGGAETFFGKNKGKTLDGMLAKLTVVLAILFVITSVSLSLIGKKIANTPVEITPEGVTEEGTEVAPTEGTEEATEVAPVEETEEATEVAPVEETEAAPEAEVTTENVAE